MIRLLSGYADRRGQIMAGMLLASSLVLAQTAPTPAPAAAPATAPAPSAAPATTPAPAAAPTPAAAASTGQQPLVGYPVLFKPYKANGIYALTEKVGWTVTPVAGTPCLQFKYTIKKFNVTKIAEGKLDLSAGPATIEAKSDEPATIMAQLIADCPVPPLRRWWLIPKCRAICAVVRSQLQFLPPKPFLPER